MQEKKKSENKLFTRNLHKKKKDKYSWFSQFYILLKKKLLQVQEKKSQPSYFILPQK